MFTLYDAGSEYICRCTTGQDMMVRSTETQHVHAAADVHLHRYSRQACSGSFKFQIRSLQWGTVINGKQSSEEDRPAAPWP